jgi:hypothetical protein
LKIANLILQFFSFQGIFFTTKELRFSSVQSAKKLFESFAIENREVQILKVFPEPLIATL